MEKSASPVDEVNDRGLSRGCRVLQVPRGPRSQPVDGGLTASTLTSRGWQRAKRIPVLVSSDT